MTPTTTDTESFFEWTIEVQPFALAATGRETGRALLTRPHLPLGGEAGAIPGPARLTKRLQIMVVKVVIGRTLLHDLLASLAIRRSVLFVSSVMTAVLQPGISIPKS